MERKLGEKSYNPGTLKLDFWGNNYNYYHNICDKKLPQAILLAAYNRPLTQEELSVELGVAMPYLEEELETLETAGLLLKNGKRYETNIIILTSEYKKELANSNPSRKTKTNFINQEKISKTSCIFPKKVL